MGPERFELESRLPLQVASTVGKRHGKRRAQCRGGDEGEEGALAEADGGIGEVKFLEEGSRDGCVEVPRVGHNGHDLRMIEPCVEFSLFAVVGGVAKRKKRGGRGETNWKRNPA